ncbi:MAG TPA: hypothetical protein VMI56_09025 [Reyranella sp.]|nr:hypothetical protein [Reyranella sp.]
MKRRMLLCASALSFGGFALRGASAQAGVWLVTTQEAALPPAAASKAARSITRGPAIRQVSPDGTVAANKPFDLHVDFAGRGGEKINAASAQIKILRGSNVDITGRLKPFITEKGIEMPAAMVPPGTHVLEVTVADASGRTTTANVEISAK